MQLLTVLPQCSILRQPRGEFGAASFVEQAIELEVDQFERARVHLRLQPGVGQAHAQLFARFIKS